MGVHHTLGAHAIAALVAKVLPHTPRATQAARTHEAVPRLLRMQNTHHAVATLAGEQHRARRTLAARQLGATMSKTLVAATLKRVEKTAATAARATVQARPLATTKRHRANAVLPQRRTDLATGSSLHRSILGLARQTPTTTLQRRNAVHNQRQQLVRQVHSQNTRHSRQLEQAQAHRHTNLQKKTTKGVYDNNTKNKRHSCQNKRTFLVIETVLCHRRQDPLLQTFRVQRE